MDELRAVQRFATGGLVPDLTILLDLPVETGLARKSAEVTRFEAYHDVAYHERVRAAFLAFAADEPERYAVVDATLEAAGVLAAALEAVGRLGDRAPCLANAAGAGAYEPRDGEPMGHPGACHDERRSPRTGGRAGAARIRPTRSSWPGWPPAVSRRSTRCTSDTRSMAYGIARRITADDVLAEDVVQDAFLGAWRSADRTRPAGAA